MSKIIAIGDTHGRVAWKTIDHTLYDKVIFVGDYVDSHYLPNQTIRQNFAEIIAFKQQHPAKVELLLGNHDIQYLYFPEFDCSGFRAAMQPDLTALFHQNQKLFTIAWQQDNYLFSHAGITNRWWNWLQQHARMRDEWTSLSIAEQLNNLNETGERRKLFTVGRARGGSQLGGPLWADESETLADPLLGYHQIVGHTPQNDLRHVPLSAGGVSVTYIDVLETKPVFYELTI